MFHDTYQPGQEQEHDHQHIYFMAIGVSKTLIKHTQFLVVDFNTYVQFP